jgi:hypothetical protein
MIKKKEKIHIDAQQRTHWDEGIQGPPQPNTHYPLTMGKFTEAVNSTLVNVVTPPAQITREEVAQSHGGRRG